MLRAASELRDALRTAAAAPAEDGLEQEVLGPAPAPVVKVNNRYRYRLFWVGRNDHWTRELLGSYIRAFHQQKNNRGLNLFIDCNAAE